jgi:hypothetical protein
MEEVMRFVAFQATDYDEVLSGYQAASLTSLTMASRHSQTSTLRTRTEMVFETLVFSPLNHLTWLIARENFIMEEVICKNWTQMER